MVRSRRSPYGVGKPKPSQLETPAKEFTMTTDTATSRDLTTVRSFFESFARRDMAAVHRLFRPDATWNHRNDDRFAGVHRGLEEIMGFMAESAQLTAGSLRPVPETLMADGEGHVAVLVRLSGTRPDGRSLDDPQMLFFTLDADQVRSVEHFVGDPAAVTAFWA
jgi:ketosteroid isomerase-like protein